MRLIYKIIKKRDEILKLAEEHGVENIRVFGSVSRGQENKDSDIDLLVDVVKKADGTKGNYIEFSLAFKKLFRKRKVDVCTPETLHPRFKDKVLKHCVSIMEDDLVIDMEEKDERDYKVNIEKAMEYINDFYELRKEYTKEDIIKSKKNRRIFRGTIQEAIEEVIRAIPKTMKKKVPEIDWEDLKNFRNFIVHHYDNVEWGVMWDTSQEKMKVIELACKRLLEILGEEGK